MNLSFIGCGYVAEGYRRTLSNYPDLKLVGAFDSNQGVLDEFVRRWPVRRYASLEELLADSSVEMAVNLTNPRNHFEINRKLLEAGKHVYSEKPLAMTVVEARELTMLAREKRLRLASAPCSVLSETAQTVWRALRSNVIGKVRLVYANFDDDMIAPSMSPWQWRNEVGVHWPAKDEFEVGCTYEHAGYLLTWLAAFFGPARRVTSFASCQVLDKGIRVETMAPDFSVGCLEYADGVVARVTCSLVAPRDKSMTIVGDEGTLTVSNVRHDDGAIWLHRRRESGWRAEVIKLVDRAQRNLDAWLPGHPWRGREWHWPRRVQLVRKHEGVFVSPQKPVDFARGPAELAASIAELRPCRLSAELALHLVEIVEAIQYPDRRGARLELTHVFDPLSPMPWAA
jgi:predicted dehydrogenase